VVYQICVTKHRSADSRWKAAFKVSDPVLGTVNFDFGTIAVGAPAVCRLAPGVVTAPTCTGGNPPGTSCVCQQVQGVNTAQVSSAICGTTNESACAQPGSVCEDTASVACETCGDGVINQPCETCDNQCLPANAPSSHGACRTGGECGVNSCTFCGDGIVNGGRAVRRRQQHRHRRLPEQLHPVACGDGIINATCEKCDGSAFPANAPASHGACRTGTCDTSGCTFCGDGVVNGDEQCDDGNAVDTDACRNNCTLPICGDGIINETCEKCDGGAFPANAPVSHGVCRTGTCGAPGCTFCGDGVVNGGEQCDDGNDFNGDGCETNCTPSPICGDGLINNSGCNETCDTNAFPAGAPASHGVCRPGPCDNPAACTFCGDGIVNGSELCDDGNNVDTDSCPNNCTSHHVP
jgi:cysteine-rich repeat protein